jgi:hypothetical protein
MATPIATLIAIARRHLNEPAEVSGGAFTDAELAALANLACNDLWRAINDNFQDYFLEEAELIQETGADTLTDVPDDCAIVRGLEVLDQSARPGLVYEHKNYTHIDFARARARDDIDPSQGGKIFYHLRGQGAPVDAPQIDVAPLTTADVTLRLTYVPTLTEVDELSDNPIPGQSNNAIVAWMVGYGMAKIAEDQAPNAGWLTLYGTEKQNMLVSLTPRQSDDEDVAEAMFEDEWQD